MGAKPSTENFLFRDAPWLGFAHDGFPRGPLQQYKAVRRINRLPTARARAALCQSLLTFGLLEAVLDTKISEKALIETLDPQTGPMVTSKNLHSILFEWFMRVQITSEETGREWLERIHTALVQTHETLHQQLQPEKNLFFIAGLPENEVGLIFHSIDSIAEVLSSGKNFFPPTLAHGGFNWSFVLGIHNPYEQQMAENGWCPMVYSIVETSVSTLQYISMQRPRISEDHTKCSRQACISRSVNIETYKVKHTTEGCNCDFLKPSFQEIAAVISREEVPVIRFEEDLNLRVQSATDTRYVAISHVWIDGLGSNIENGLPRCQLYRIAQKTGKLVPDGAFWIDSLCVPERRDLRKRAIGLMGQTYKDAAVVLVFDSGIRRCSVDENIREKLLQVRSSGWMTRLWTFQEAALAQQLLFDFADGFVELDDLKPGYLSHTGDIVSVFLASEIFRLGRHRRRSSKREPLIYDVQLPNFTLGDVARALKWRTTSKLGDETLAVASLLNISAFELVNLPAEERMAHLLCQVKGLQRQILFLAGPKLKSLGFRWVPTTFMNIAPGPLLSTNPPDAWCSGEGLVATFGVLRFPRMVFKAKQDWSVRIQNASPKEFVTVVEAEEASEDENDCDFVCNALVFPGKTTIERLQVCVAVLLDEAKGIQMVGEIACYYCDYKRRLIGGGQYGEVDASKGLVINGEFFPDLFICVR